MVSHVSVMIYYLLLLEIVKLQNFCSMTNSDTNISNFPFSLNQTEKLTLGVMLGLLKGKQTSFVHTKVVSNMFKEKMYLKKLYHV